jgi:hypothetical protein
MENATGGYDLYPGGENVKYASKLDTVPIPLYPDHLRNEYVFHPPFPLDFGPAVYKRLPILVLEDKMHFARFKEHARRWIPLHDTNSNTCSQKPIYVKKEMESRDGIERVAHYHWYACHIEVKSEREVYRGFALLEDSGGPMDIERDEIIKRIKVAVECEVKINYARRKVYTHGGLWPTQFQNIPGMQFKSPYWKNDEPKKFKSIRGIQFKSPYLKNDEPRKFLNFFEENLTTLVFACILSVGGVLYAVLTHGKK